MSIEAMKQALEALELHAKQYPHMQKGYTVDAITALRQAIAEAEKQEPVACPYPCGWNNLLSIIIKKGAYLATSTLGDEEPLSEYQRQEMMLIIGYAKTLASWGKTNHPPKREWVGLTDEEIEQGCKESWVTLQAWQSAVWWAEAKLKQKNGGGA